MQAAQRWVKAVNADGRYGQWEYGVAWKSREVRKRIEEAVAASR